MIWLKFYLSFRYRENNFIQRPNYLQLNELTKLHNYQKPQTYILK